MMPAPTPPPVPQSPWSYPAPVQQPQWSYPAPVQPPYASLQRPAGYGYPPATNYAPGYYPQPAPRTGMSHGSRLLLFLVLMPLSLFLVILVVKILSTIGEVAPTPSPQPTMTTTTSPAPTDTTSPVQPGNYKNDDYVVPEPDPFPPDLPAPDDFDEATLWMQNNIIYSSQVPSPVRCELDSVDPSTASKAQMQTYLDGIVGCLMRVWAPELQAAGFNASTPSVVVYSGSGQSACGKLSKQNAFYCAGDQQIYYSMDLPSLLPKYKHDPILPFQIMAHEFGHAIQAQTGILWAESAWQQSYTDDNDKASAMQISRRTEMQADCFAGQFLSAVQQSTNISPDEHQVLLAIMLQLGDDSVTGITGYSGDHGLGANRQYWFGIGLSTATMGACNTYATDVPASKVK